MSAVTHAACTEIETLLETTGPEGDSDIGFKSVQIGNRAPDPLGSPGYGNTAVSGSALAASLPSSALAGGMAGGPDAASRTGISGPQSATGDQNVDGLLSGVKWVSGSLRYSFPTLSSQYEPLGSYAEPVVWGFSGATAELKVATRAAMALISEYTNLTITEVDAGSAAEIRSAFYSWVDPTAFAYFPSNNPKGGDVWYGTEKAGYRTPVKGQFGWHTVLHEVGHAFGLKHGHEDGGPADVSMMPQFDKMSYSIMTYRSYENDPLASIYTNGKNDFAQTYMMYDIYALQIMYGANFNSNSTNTEYSWSPSSGELFINSIGQGAPGGNRVFSTVWDGGGTDTYDFGIYNTDLKIDINPGAYSVTSRDQIANLGDGYFAEGNVYNALQFRGDLRSLIENAKGGSGNDAILGNAANNTLGGGAGDDTVNGRAGNDSLSGGSGWDIASFAQATTGVSANLATGRATGEGNDSLDGFEALMGSAFNDTLTGDDRDNVLNIGAGGADLVAGGQGFDTISFADLGLSVSVDMALLKETRTGTSFTGIEAVQGSAQDDILLGDTGSNWLGGGNANDTLHGGSGDDTLSGGAGSDVLNGGSGDDVAQYLLDPGLLRIRSNGSGSFTVELLSSEIDELTSIERIVTRDGTVSVGPDLAGAFRTNVSGDNFLLLGTAYSGPVAGLQRQYLGTSAGEVVGGTQRNDFMNLLAGDDAASGGSGDDVLDGGTGSNFLTGGAGRDVFFSDGRGGTVTWSTVTDWGAGEQLSLWGWRPGISKATWDNAAGAPGYTGVTMFGDLNADGVIDTTVTWSGLTRASLPRPLEFDGLLWFIG